MSNSEDIPDRNACLEIYQAKGCTIVDNQELSDRFPGGCNSAPMMPVGGNFIISDHGGLVDTCKATLRPPRPQLAKEFTPESLVPYSAPSAPKLESPFNFNKKN